MSMNPLVSLYIAFGGTAVIVIAVVLFLTRRGK